MVEACANCSLLDCGMIGTEYHCFASNRMAKQLKAMILGNLQFGLICFFIRISVWTIIHLKITLGI